MNDSVKNLTLASILTSLFVVITIFALSTGLGYGIYLDFAVPIFFALVYLKCGGKYTVLSGIVSVLLVFMVVGDLAGALFISQSFLLGVICAYFMDKDSILMEDIFFASILGTFTILLVDLYTKGLTGYSLITEFKEMAAWFPYKDYLNFFIYLLIAFYVGGMCFCIYYISLFLGKRLKILTKNAEKKYYIFRNLKAFNRFLCLKRSTFYACAIYIFIVELLNILNVKIDFIYLRVILISIEYLAFYYLFRDSIIIIQDYILTRSKKVLYVRLFMLAVLLPLFFVFKLEFLILVVVSYIIDVKKQIRLHQKKILDLYYEKVKP